MEAMLSGSPLLFLDLRDRTLLGKVENRAIVVAVRGTLLALRRRARPLARATPATYEDVSGGAHTTSGVVRRTSALGAGSFWRTWRPR